MLHFLKNGFPHSSFNKNIIIYIYNQWHHTAKWHHSTEAFSTHSTPPNEVHVIPSFPFLNNAVWGETGFSTRRECCLVSIEYVLRKVMWWFEEESKIWQLYSPLVKIFIILQKKKPPVLLEATMMTLGEIGQISFLLDASADSSASSSTQEIGSAALWF